MADCTVRLDESALRAWIQGVLPQNDDHLLEWLKVRPKEQAVLRVIGAETCAIAKVWLGPRHGLSAADRFRRERAALSACNSIDRGSPAPRLLSANSERLWMLTAYIPETTADRWPTAEALGSALGRLHGGTAPTARIYPELQPWRERPKAQRVVELLRATGINPALAKSFCSALDSTASGVRRCSVVCHGDIVSHNLLSTRRNVHLVDFELSEAVPRGHDLAAVALGFPTAEEPAELSAEALANFRRGYLLATGDDGMFDENLSACAARWLLIILGTHLPGLEREDRIWGTCSVRLRVLARLRLFAKLGPCVVTNRMAAEIAAQLGRAWALTMTSLPLLTA